MTLKFGSVSGRGIIDLFILITQLMRFFPLHSTSRDTGQVERMLDFLPAHPQLWAATVDCYFLLLVMEITMKHLIFTVNIPTYAESNAFGCVCVLQSLLISGYETRETTSILKFGAVTQDLS